MSNPFPHKQGGAKPVEPEPVLPPKPQGDLAAKVEPAPSASHHLIHGLRDVAIVAGLAAATYAASDDFAHLLQAHPEIAAYVPAFQMVLRAILVAWGKTATAARKQ